MHTLYSLSRLLTSDRARQAGRRLGREARALLGALASPGRMVEEVKAMRALHLEAERIEATHPVRAALLRVQASAISRT